MKVVPQIKENNLEFLTDEEVKKFTRAFRKRLFVNVAVGVFIIQIVVFSIFQLLIFSSRSSLASLQKEEQDQLATQARLSTVTGDLQTVKAKLQIYNQLPQGSNLDTNLKKTTSFLPADISVTTLGINSKGMVTIAGSGNDSASVYQFYEKLLSETSITGVSINSVSKVDSKYTFNMIFTFK